MRRSEQGSGTPPVDATALKDAIQAREKEWSAAFLAGNAAGIAALYTEDAQSIQPQATSKATKKPVASSGRYMVLWRKDADGIWRLQRDIGTEAPAKAPPAVPAKKG